MILKISAESPRGRNFLRALKVSLFSDAFTECLFNYPIRDKGDIARIANISEFSFLLNKKLTLYA